MAVRTFVLLGLLVAILLGVYGPLQPEAAVASTHRATRSLSAPWVLPGGELRVTVAASGYASFGLLKETLPAGFTFVASDLNAAAVLVEGQTVSFTLLGVERVTYTVTAPAAEGRYIFTGVLLDAAKTEQNVGRASAIRVGPAPTPTPVPTATPAPTATATTMPTATATPEPTATPPPQPTATATPEPTPTPSPQPTATATPEPTPSPQPTATATAEPATPTAPAAPAVPLVEDTEEEGGPSALLWLLLMVLGVAVLAAIIAYLRLRR